VIGDYSGPRSFFTGPECTSPAELLAPDRLGPEDGSVVNTLTPALKFTPDVPGCIPDGYLLHLHTLADFSDPNLLTEYSIPATTVITEPLTNCQDYYWSVTAVQDGGYGPPSDVGMFTVDVDGSCLPPGIPAKSLNNNFCREGTFEEFKALATIVEGDLVLAIARNPLTTYLQLTILDQETKQPYKNEIHCWSYIKNFQPGWPLLTPVVQYKFEDLPVLIPPPTATPTHVPDNICHPKLDLNDCRVYGGRYNKDTQICFCP
jgi:hypothetical protein